MYESGTTSALDEEMTGARLSELPQEGNATAVEATKRATAESLMSMLFVFFWEWCVESCFALVRLKVG